MQSLFSFALTRKHVSEGEGKKRASLLPVALDSSNRDARPVSRIQFPFTVLPLVQQPEGIP